MRVEPLYDRPAQQSTSHLFDRLIVARPGALRRRRMQQRLHYHAVLFGFFAQGADLFWGGISRRDVEAHANVFEAYGGFFRYAQGAYS